MWKLCLNETNPSRTAGGEHGALLQLAAGKPLHKFMAFFHNCQIRRKCSIKHIIHTHPFQGIQDLAYCCVLRFNPKLLSPGCTNGRRHLRHHYFIFICDRVPDLLCIIPAP